MKTLRMAWVLGMLLAPPSSALALTVYDTLGPADTYSNSGNWFGTQTFEELGPVTYKIAAGFQPSASGQFDELWLGAQYLGGNNAFTLHLFSDDLGSMGTQLWSQTFTGQLPGWGPGSLFHAADLNGPFLTPGSTYWLMAETTPDSFHNWSRNALGAGGNIAYWGSPDSWRYDKVDEWALALRVGVDPASPVPEPGSLLLVGTGLAAFALSRRRNRG
jgi:hypothetical protein